MRFPPPVVLASASPRRREMMRQAGFEVAVATPAIDDGRLDPKHASPAAWVMAMAYLKARSVGDLRARTSLTRGTLVAADTVCVHQGRILGQPCDADHARAMLRSLREATHRTLTGVCMISLDDGSRLLFADGADVHVGAIGDDEIDRYVSSGAWRGKAGGYNLAERVEAGWPIECVGDPSTVMGLPMRRMQRLLRPMREAC